MTKNQIAMRNIGRGTAGTIVYGNLRDATVSGHGALKPKCRRRLDRDEAATIKKWKGADKKCG